MANHIIAATLKMKDGYSKVLKNYEKEVKGVGNTTKKAFGGLKSNVLGALGLTAGIAGIVAVTKKSVVAFADLEVQNIKNRNIIGATKEEFKKLEKQQKDFAENSIYNSSEVAKAQEYMARAGWSVNKIFSATPAIMNLVTASGEDLATVSDIVTDGMTAMGLGAEKTGEFTDKLLVASNKSNTSISQLGEAFKYVAPVASQLGDDTSSLTTMLGIMANAGIKASMAGTTLRSAYSRLIKPVGDGQKALKRLGIQTVDSKGNFLGMVNITNQLRRSLDGQSDSVKAQAIEMIFGKQAVAGMLSVIGSTEKQVNSFKKAIDSSTGSVKSQADEIENSTNGSIKKMKTALDDAAISFGALIAPTVKEDLDIFTKYINSLKKDTPEATKKIDDLKRHAIELGIISAGFKIGGPYGGLLALAGAGGWEAGQKLTKKGLDTKTGKGFIKGLTNHLYGNTTRNGKVVYDPVVATKNEMNKGKGNLTADDKSKMNIFNNATINIQASGDEHLTELLKNATDLTGGAK